MYAGVVKNVCPVGNSQEPGGLLKCFVSLPSNFADRLAILERALAVAMRDDLFGKLGPYPGYIREQRGRGGIYINANGVYVALGDPSQRACQRRLIDVVLVHADSNALGVYFYEFCQ